MESHFDPDNTIQYARWRLEKLDAYPAGAGELVTNIDDPSSLSSGERLGISRNLAKANLAIYQCSRGMDRVAIRALASQFGLERLEFGSETGEDGITSLRADVSADPSAYIPYSRKPLNWHTDGYYNTADSRIHGFLLHCCNTAQSGGENSFLDHEIAYIHLRDLDPEHINALMAEDAMTIPANISGGTVLRAECTGPVFYTNQDHKLQMRYTHRTRSIYWKNDPALDRARAALAEILESSPYILQHTLKPGQGILCNNVLHCRSGFTDSPDQTRHLYRIRSLDCASLEVPPAVVSI